MAWSIQSHGYSRDFSSINSIAMGDDSTRMYSVRTCGVTTEAPRMGELECFEPSVYVNSILSYRRAGVEEGMEERESVCEEER